MLPAYRIEILEYEDDTERETRSKPHIVFEDPEYKPLADLLNWRFPDAELLRDTLAYLDRPWHELVQKRGLHSEWADLTVTRDGQARIASLTRIDLVEENGEVLLLSEQELIEAVRQVIAEAEQLDLGELAGV